MRKQKVDWKDVQGIVRKGYGRLPFSKFILLEVINARKAGIWLGEHVQFVTQSEFADDKNAISNQGFALNIAVTAPGMRALNLDDDIVRQFSREFVTGMAPDPTNSNEPFRRSAMLGDEGDNAPSNWLWGAAKPSRNAVPAGQIHLMMMLYADTQENIEQLRNKFLTPDCGLQELRLNYRRGKDFDGYLSHREHFGFQDGISQPKIENFGPSNSLASRINEIAEGEMILGYDNERGQKSPVPEGEVAGKTVSFGRNGTYMVVRHLEQNADQFWQQVESQAGLIFPGIDRDTAMNRVAASLMGRDVDGKALIKSNEAENVPPAPEGYFIDPAEQVDDFVSVDEGQNKFSQFENDFVFDAADKNGLSCPKTAHIRRSFPRDTLGPDPVINLKLSKRHRILRRARLFGDGPIVGPPQSSAKGRKTKGGPYGMYFIALNADIAGQFETIQHSWMNNRHFGGQYDEVDPVAGQGDGKTCKHTVQGRPYNICMDGLHSCVKVRGGAYFFLPGIQALKAMAKVAISAQT